VFASSPQRKSPRAQLGSPFIPVNAPASYLRHRAAAVRAQRTRQRTGRLRWIAVMATIAALYVAIGHELALLTRAKLSLVSAEVRGEVGSLTKDLGNIGRLKRAKTAPALPDVGQRPRAGEPETTP